jgi:hypothetical protein
MNPDYHSLREERDILITCALRFDGHKYVKDRKFDHMVAFQAIEQTGDLSAYTQEQQLALFFMFQRYLYKWGGETLSHRSPEWRTFRELFFLCCRADIPEQCRLGPEYEKWESSFAPHIDDCIALVRSVHASIDYLPVTTVDPSLHPDYQINIERSRREKLGLSHEYVRQFEQRALEAFKLFPDAAVERTRDAIQINVREERGIVLLFTPDNLELRLPTVDWTQGAYGPVPSSVLWKRVKLTRLRGRQLYDLCHEALRARAAEYVPCRFCGREFPPEHRHDDVCHDCAERELGIVH